MTKLQRMMFLQGQICFFCNRPIPKAEASVEHLIPSSTGGSDHPDNLVACCKTLNTLFGNMNVKEKMRAILKQNGKFICPSLQAQPHPNNTSLPNQQTQPPERAAQSDSASTKPAKYGQPWTLDDEQRLDAAFAPDVSLAEFAKLLDRSEGAIRCRLIKLGKLPPE